MMPTKMIAVGIVRCIAFSDPKQSQDFLKARDARQRPRRPKGDEVWERCELQQRTHDVQ
jgi:hypothetical protein